MVRWIMGTKLMVQSTRGNHKKEEMYHPEYGFGSPRGATITLQCSIGGNNYTTVFLECDSGMWSKLKMLINFISAMMITMTKKGRWMLTSRKMMRKTTSRT